MGTETVTTVILIRHADRDVPPAGTPAPPDPPLNDKGMRRSVRLIHVLGATGIQAVYTSDFIRAKMTARPFLTNHPGIPHGLLTTPLAPVRLTAATELSEHILAHNAGRIILVVGHSDTVPALIGLLGGPSLPNIDDCEFDNLFILVRYSATMVSLTKAHARVHLLKRTRAGVSGYQFSAISNICR